MPACSPERVRWVAQFVIPAEPSVRLSLRKSGAEPDEIDDLIQDAYCKLAGLTSVENIEKPEAFFMQMVKNLRRDRLRRDKIVQFEEFTEVSASNVKGWGPSPEEEVSARHELSLVEAVLSDLPQRCRDIFTLKRIEGLSQRDIAKRLGVTESIVENDVRKAVKTLQRRLRGPEAIELKETKLEAAKKRTG